MTLTILRMCLMVCHFIPYKDERGNASCYYTSQYTNIDDKFCTSFEVLWCPSDHDEICSIRREIRQSRLVDVEEIARR